jgi:hypothetical protein
MARFSDNRLLAPLWRGLTALSLLPLSLIETPSAAPPGGVGAPPGLATSALQALQQDAVDHGSVPVIVDFDVSDKQPGGRRGALRRRFGSLTICAELRRTGPRND